MRADRGVVKPRVPLSRRSIVEIGGGIPGGLAPSIRTRGLERARFAWNLPGKRVDASRSASGEVRTAQSQDNAQLRKTEDSDLLTCWISFICLYCLMISIIQERRYEA